MRFWISICLCFRSNSVRTLICFEEMQFSDATLIIREKICHWYLLLLNKPELLDIEFLLCDWTRKSVFGALVWNRDHWIFKQITYQNTEFFWALRACSLHWLVVCGMLGSWNTDLLASRTRNQQFNVKLCLVSLTVLPSSHQLLWEFRGLSHSLPAWWRQPSVRQRIFSELISRRLRCLTNALSVDIKGRQCAGCHISSAKRSKGTCQTINCFM